MNIEDIYPTIDECTIEWLQGDLSRADDFLEVGLEEYSHDNELKELLHTIRCIAAAKELELINTTADDKETLDKLLTLNPNPSWEKVLDALGYCILEVSEEPAPLF